jgi:hypothetical protein
MNIIELLTFIIQLFIYCFIGYNIYVIWTIIEPYVTPLIEAFKWLYDRFKELFDIVKNMGGTIRDIGSFLEKMVKKLGDIILSLGSLPQKIADLVKKLIEPINTAIDELRKAINVATGGLAGGASSLVDGAKKFFRGCDERIKENIVPADNEEILNKINSIPVKKYNYIDKNMYNGKTINGVIAQDIKKIIPEAVIICKDFLPNIYQYAKFETIKNEINDEKVENDKIKLVLDNNLNIDLVKGSRLKLIMNDLIYIKEIIDFTDSTITINNCTDFNDQKEILVYGIEIDDFHKLDQSYLSMLCIGGIQQLCKQLKQSNNELLERLDKIENKLI